MNCRRRNFNTDDKNIVPHGAGAHVLDESQGGGDIVGDDTSTQAVVGVVGPVHHLFEGLELKDALDRSEDLEMEIENRFILLHQKYKMPRLRPGGNISLAWYSSYLNAQT